MHINLSRKNALVGGGSDGIGKAIAQQLAESGASATVMSHSEDKLKAIVEAFPTGQGQKHQVLVADFNDFEDYKQQITAYFEKNTVDILVNNTQGPSAGTALEKEIEDYQQAFDLLFKVNVFTTELALKHMRKQQWGRVINVASVSVKEPKPDLVLSNTLRAALVTWAKSLSREVGPDQITVNSVLTGYFDTQRLVNLNAKKAKERGVDQAEIRKEMEAKVPVRRIGNPEEYGYLVSFLASDKAAYISGTQIPIDGGALKGM
ncbi:SDR family oxidoreductase [Zunongwangia sp. F363]|uniref:SDR family oxidoreductase n=1 Tax=Autumnicola tepida TaxID=3075595 RepID=A0ABU3C5A6_9FLAO|nr:SDR family oxidoreductase [Zunongwangia sp. F363]MDT0641506.1 SDR family oxidoreductase [Zunongwangia sp. F363]